MATLNLPPLPTRTQELKAAITKATGRLANLNDDLRKLVVADTIERDYLVARMAIIIRDLDNA